MAFLQTRWAKDNIAGLVETQLGGPESGARFAGLSGFVPFDMGLGELRLADEEGVWLELADAEFDFSLTSLFSGDVRLRAVGAREVTVHRAPVSNEPPPPPAEGPLALPELPELPESLPSIAVDRLFVDHLVLGEALAGQPIELKIDGGVATVEQGTELAARLDVEGLGETRLTLDLDAGFELAGPTLELNLDVAETGGLVASLAGQPELGDASLRWRGRGLLEDWQSRLDAQLAGLVKAELGIDLAYTDQPGLRIAGNVQPDGTALPEQLASLLAEPIEIALSADQESPGVFKLGELGITSAFLKASGAGRFEQEGPAFSGDLALDAPSLAALSSVAGTDLAGSLRVDVNAAGDVGAPVIDIAIDGRDLAAAGVELKSVGGGFNVELSGDESGSLNAAVARGEVTFDDLRQGDRAMFAGDPIRLTLDADVPFQGEIGLHELALRSNAFALNASGVTDPAAGTATAELALDILSLATLAQALGEEIEGIGGSTRLVANIDAGEAFQVLNGQVELVSEDFQGLPGGADPLIGLTPGLRFDLAADLREAAEISGLRVDLAALSIEGGVRAMMDESQTLSGGIRASMPDLAALSELAGQPIAGSAAVDLTLSGTQAAPAAQLAAVIDALEAAGQRFEALRLNADVSDAVAAPQGSLRFVAEQTAGELSINTDFAMREQQLDLANLAISAPQTALEGGIAVDLAGPLARGELKGGIADFAALRPWHGQDLDGSMDVDITLSAETGQDATVDLRVPELQGDFGTLRGLRVDAQVRDALGALTTESRVVLEGFAQDAISLDRTELTANGDLADLALNLKTSGSQADQPFDAELVVGANLADAAKVARITRLRGSAGGQEFNLRQPATITLDGEIVDVDRLDLELAEASIQGNLRKTGTNIDGQLDLSDLDLARLEAFGAPPIAGAINAALAIQGGLGAPRIDVDVKAADLKPNDPGYAQAEGLNIDVLAGIANGQATARLGLSGLSNEPLEVNAAVPLRLALEPFAFELAENAPIDGAIRGVLQLDRLAELAQLDGQVLRGVIDADVALGGMVSKPVLEGEIALSDGLLEDSATGISLKFMRGTLKASAYRFALDGFEARDGDGGKLSVNGEVALGDANAASPIAYDFRIGSEDMRLLSNELGRIYANLDLAVAGDASRGSASGTVLVSRAEIAIPSGGGVDPIGIEVRRKGEEAPAPTEAAADEGEAPPPYLVDLDIAVDLPSRTFVRGRGLDSEWGGSLNVSGTSAEPVVLGSIEYRRGFMDFLDRRFDIESGTITFSGANPPIPEIDLRAEAEGGEITGIISVTGPATDIGLTLTSEPERPQDEVISALLFDRDVSQITPAQAVRLASAVRTLEGGGNDLMGQVREAIGVDTIDVGGDSPDTASASVGKYITDKVFLQVERSLATGQNKARVEYELNPNLSVNTEVSDDSQAGVGLQWSLDY